MKTIVTSKKTGGASTNSEGYILKQLLLPYFINNERVQVSFEGSTPMSSSFFNSSFGELIDDYGYDKFRNIVVPVHITRVHLNLIKKYIQMHLENEAV